MRIRFVFAVMSAAAASACVGPVQEAPSVPYREPRGNDSAYEGLPNAAQRRHLYSAEFPRLQHPEEELLREINAEVNRELVYLPDLQNYGVADYPATEPPVRRPWLSTLPPARYADCEDYALTKKHRLAESGFSASRTFVATAIVPNDEGRTVHSVLAVPEGPDWLILNNWHNQIQRAGSLERWWEWKFIRPRYDSYLLAMQVRRIAGDDGSSASAPGAGVPARR